jgi:hypothetical protein
MLAGVDRLVQEPGEYLETCEICGCLNGGDEYSGRVLYNLKFCVQLDTWFTDLIWTVFSVVHSVFCIVL